MTRYNIMTKKVRTSGFLAALSRRDVPHHHTCINEQKIVQNCGRTSKSSNIAINTHKRLISLTTDNNKVENNMLHICNTAQ